MKYPSTYWATPADEGLVKVLSREELPDGELCLTVPCDDYSALRSLPKMLTYEGARYGRTGWNSDLRIAYFKTGWPTRCFAAKAPMKMFAA